MTEQQQSEFKILKDQVNVVNERIFGIDRKVDEIINAVTGNKLSNSKGMVGQMNDLKAEQLLMQEQIENLKDQINEIKNIMDKWKGIAIGIMTVSGIIGWFLKEIITKAR